MIAILYRAPVIEDIVIEECKKFLNEVRFAELFPNSPTVQVSSEHPFARLMDRAAGNPGHPYDGSMFPSITIVAGEDSKTDQLASTNRVVPVSLTKAEIEDLSDSSMVAAPGALAWMTEWTEENGTLYGHQSTSFRSDRISFDIWSESIQLKNELHSLLIAFLTGPKRREIESSHGIRIFDRTIHGQRSGNYNMDFGQLLYGAHLDCVADYEVSTAIFDSDITKPESSIGVRRA